MSATGVAIGATATAPFRGTVATFTDADPAGTAGDYTATIDWGDGTTGPADSIAADAAIAGQFDVTGSHTYASRRVVRRHGDDPRRRRRQHQHERRDGHRGRPTH